MKPFRFSAFSRRLLGTAAVITLTHQASAQTQLYWKTTAAAAPWATAANWSTAAASGGATAGAAPGTTTVANFSVTNPPNTVAQTVTLPALSGTPLTGQSVKQIVTLAQTTTTTIRSDGNAATTLTLGNPAEPQYTNNGINHANGGLVIGSTTATQAVNIILAADQVWKSSASGNSSLTIHNNISSSTAAVTYRVLELQGVNTGAIINGNITNGGAEILYIDKHDTGLWTLAGTTNTFAGPLQINKGTIRLTNRGAATPANIWIGGEATLSLRAGGAGFTAAQIDEMRTGVDYGSSKSDFAIDTANGNFEYDRGLYDGVTKKIFTFRKLGGNTLTLTGNNSAAFTGQMTVSEGTLALGTPAAQPKPGSPKIISEGSGTLAPVVGGAGFTPAEVDALIANTSFEKDLVNNVRGSFGISTAGGDVHYPAVVSLPDEVRFNKTGANTLMMTGANTYTTPTLLSGGSLSVSQIPNGGIPSPLGASSNAATNLILAGGRLTYTGAALTPDRLFSMNGSGGIDASGTGALTFGAGTISHSGAGGRNLTLSGINQDANTIASTLINSGTGTNTTSVFKTGYGNWILNGPNTATGFVRGRGGNVTLDYSDVDPWAGSALIQSGTIILKAVPSRKTDTMPTLQIGEQHNGLGILKLTGGMDLTVTWLDGNGATQRHNLIDLSDNGGTINITGINSGTSKHFDVSNNGLLNNNSATDVANGRANLVLRTQDGTYGFAALAPGTTGGPLQKLANLTTVTPGSAVTINTAATNYYLGAGTYTTAGNANYSTLTFDSSAGAVNFSLPAANTLSPGGTGKAILASGANDVSISGGNPTSAITQPIWLHNYVDPSATLNISSNLGTGGYFIIGGTGYTNYSGRGLGQKTSPSDTQFVLNGGVFRMTQDQNLATAPGVLRVSDGIFEIGADLNGDTVPGDFTRASGTSFRLLGNAGFSAYTSTPGGTRVANFSNAAPLVWGATDFLTSTVDNTDGDYAFRLGSPRSNATIEFTNAIDLNGHLRVVEVADGSAGTDAVLSGILSGSVTSGLVKTGPGTLALTGANTYGGETRVFDGVLRIQAGSIPPNSRLVIQGAGRVSVVGNVGVQSVVINGVEQAPGAVSSALVAGNLYVGAAPAGMTYAQWVTNKTLQPSESGELFDADKDGLLNLLEYGLGTEPKVPNGSVLTHNAGSSTFRFNRATDRTDISTIIEASETMTGTWATIATSTGMGPFVLQAGVTGVSIDESTPGTVIVTTSPTGAPAKKFHRVRVTK